ncbi:hypothetical protein [Paenibacillus piscarius]|uniref:hypothetical protein n=1 Tax=Paenibacillus piscarius TaxID=1089681 RepID=UPI001EE838E2|nr:hypothetical protein [Paenibacillus piscarius]
MIPAATVNIEVDQQAIARIIEEQISKQVHQQLLLMDINKIAELTSMSVRYLEDEILSDPRVRMYERKKQRKRWWLAQPTLKAIEEIVSSW